MDTTFLGARIIKNKILKKVFLLLDSFLWKIYFYSGKAVDILRANFEYFERGCNE